MKKILVIRYRFIGDTLMTIPFLRNLRAANPDAQIDMLVSPSSGEVLENCPYIDNLIFYSAVRKGESKRKRSFLSCAYQLRKKKYDKAYVLKRSLSSAMLAFMSGIPERVGFNTELRRPFLTTSTPYDKRKHEIECFLDLLRADDVPVNDNYLENWTSSEANYRVNQIYRENDVPSKPSVLIAATSGHPAKQWSREKFAEVVEYLSNAKDVQVFFLGTSEDRAMYEQILAAIPADLYNKPVNLCGQLTLQESLALINRMNFVVGVDSGILHMAASVRVPVIGLYGPMSVSKWHVWGNMHTVLVSDRKCVPCALKGNCTSDYACMEDLTAEMVIEKVNAMLEKIRVYAY